MKKWLLIIFCILSLGSSAQVISDDAVFAGDTDTFESKLYFGEADIIPYLGWPAEQDSKGYFWFLARKDGAYRVSTSSVDLFSYKLQQLPFKSFLSMHNDQYGDTWFGSEKGVVKYEALDNTFTLLAQDFMPENNEVYKGVKAILRLDSTLLFLGTNRGYFFYNIQKNEILRDYRSDSLANNSNANLNRCNGVIFARNSKDIIWITTKRGLIKLNWKTNVREVISWPNNIGSTNDGTFYRYPFTYKNKVFVQRNVKDFYCYDFEIKKWSKAFDQFKAYTSNGSKIKTVNTYGISRVNERYMLLNSPRRGPIVFDMQENKLHQIYVKNPVFEIIENNELELNLTDKHLNYCGFSFIDKNGYLWSTHRSKYLVKSTKPVFKTNKPYEIKGFDVQSLIVNGESIDWKKISLDSNLFKLRDYERSIKLNAAFINPSKDENLNYRFKHNNHEWFMVDTNYEIQINRLDGGKNIITIEARENENVISTKEIVFEVQKLWHEKWGIRIGILLLVLGLPILVYWIRMNQLKKQKKMENAFNKRVAELEMASLKTQMNPHFLFNSLNSIKHYSLTKTKEETAEYITVFSRLIRQILQNSNDKVVSLANELHAVKLYVEVESRRFQEKFDYDINLDANINPDVIFVPPLLIQPYVENAIWHGLMHKDKRGKLLIRFEEDGDHVLCIIQDDGVGRKVAEEINKRKQQYSKKSLGTKITANRLSLFKELYDKEAKVIIKDLLDAQGESLGTLVTIKLPKLNNLTKENE